MVLYYLNDCVIEKMLNSDDDFIHRLERGELVRYGKRLQAAIDSVYEGTQFRASIGPVLRELLIYCLKRKTSRVLWFVDFSSSPLMCQLARAIVMIHRGYEANFFGHEDWPWIYALIRELLIPECRKYYTPACDGFSLQNLCAWAVLYDHYDLDKSFPDLSEDLGPMLDRADKWSNHLACKVEEGDEYRRIEDPWYDKKYAEWLSVNDPCHQKRVDFLSAQRAYNWEIMTNDKREEYHSEESSFDDEELSTDGESSVWGVDKRIS